MSGRDLKSACTCLHLYMWHTLSSEVFTAKSISLVQHLHSFGMPDCLYSTTLRQVQHGCVLNLKLTHAIFCSKFQTQNRRNTRKRLMPSVIRQGARGGPDSLQIFAQAVDMQVLYHCNMDSCIESRGLLIAQLLPQSEQSLCKQPYLQ